MIPHKLYFLIVLCISITGTSQNNSLKSTSKIAQDFYEKKNADSALIFADKLLAEAREKDSTHYMIVALYLKGRTLYDLEKTKEAMDKYYEALKLCRDTSENNYKATIYNSLGLINYEEKNIAIAKHYYKEEIRIRKEQRDTGRIVNCLINMSAMHRRLKELDSSGYVLKEAGMILGKPAQNKTFAHYNHALGTHFQTIYKRDSLSFLLDSAVKYYSTALDLWLKLKIKSEALRPLFNMGLIYQSKGEFDKALVNYKQAETIVNELDLKKEKITVLGNMAELYWDMKDYKQSAEYFRQYIETKDVLQKEDINYYALQLDKQMQTEQNKETIQKQKLEIVEKNKRLYLTLLVSALVFGLLLLAAIYFNFQKRLGKKIAEAKKKFFSNVVHEIRTPLSMIQAPLIVLKQKAPAEDIANFELAEQNIGRLNELISQMLDISKIDSDKYVLNETFGDLEIFLTQTVNNYSNVALQKNIGIVREFNFGPRLAIFDKDALEKITGNLLSNAIKYSSPNSLVGINASTEEFKEGVKLTLNIWDTGAGISEKEQGNIFNRFYRSKKTETETKGVGIGLALVKDLVDLQKGSIELISAENKGSSFTVVLSFKGAEEISASPGLLNIGENQYQVLLVEDDKDILEFNAKHLESNNFKVLRSSGTDEALKLIEKNLPDLIVSDLMMPGTSGLEFLKMIRSNQASDHIPFIMLSAKSSADTRIQILQAGAQQYMAKPFVPDELVAVITNQLEILNKRKKEFQQLIEEPEKQIEVKLSESDPYIQKLTRLVLEHLEDSEFSVEKLADLMAINRSHFQRKVKALTGLSPSDIIKTIRMEKSRELLLSKTANVTEVAYSTGFSSQSYFTKVFTQHFGISPSAMLHAENVNKKSPV